MQRIDESFAPMIKAASGFLSYYALDAGIEAIAIISVFEDQAGTEESTMVAEFIRQKLPSLLPLPPQIIAGEIATHALNLGKLSIRKAAE